MTLPRKLRVPRSAFVSASKARNRAMSEHFSLTWGPSLEGGCAAVVSKKVAKRSVDRHLLKRRMLEVLRPAYSPSRSLIAFARAGSPKLSFKELKGELASLLTRV